MKEKIEKELIKYYIEKEKLINSTNKKDMVRLNIINTIINRIKFINFVSKKEDYEKIIFFEKQLLDKNFAKNIDNLDALYVLKWLEYNKFLNKVCNNRKKLIVY